VRVIRAALVLALVAIAVAMFTTPAQTGPKLADYYTMIASRVIDPDFSPLWLDVTPFSADLDGDGNEDLVVLGVDYGCCGVTPNLPQPSRIFFGDGNGNFTAPAPGQFPMDSFKMVYPQKAVFGDVNGDGRLDMLIACDGPEMDPFPGEQNRLYLSEPGGGWRDATATLPQLSDFTLAAAMADLRGRGVLDIIVGNAFGAQNHISSYSLLNDGAGNFTMTRANIPARPGEVMDAESHFFTGITLADLDDDGLPELILLYGDPGPYNKLTGSTILWNHGGAFTNDGRTELPPPAAFPTNHEDLSAQPIDFDGDGLPDLVIVGTDATTYDAWFVQLLRNQGNGTFVDVTASRLAPSDVSGQTRGVSYSTAPWAKRVKVLDFNGDGFPDFSVEYYPASVDSSGRQALPPSQPLIYLNDGNCHFSALKVGDFVAPGSEWVLGGGHLMRTRNGYSFITPYLSPYEGGLHVTGLLATQPYRQPAAPWQKVAAPGPSLPAKRRG